MQTPWQQGKEETLENNNNENTRIFDQSENSETEVTVIKDVWDAKVAMNNNTYEELFIERFLHQED